MVTANSSTAISGGKNMSDYSISKIYPNDSYASQQIDNLLHEEGIRRDAHLDYTCGMYDDDMNIIATGSLFGNTLRYMAVSHAHQGEGLMNEIVTHLIETQFERGNTHLFLYTKCSTSKFFGDLGFYAIAQISGQLVFMENRPLVPDSTYTFFKPEKLTGNAFSVAARLRSVLPAGSTVSLSCSLILQRKLKNISDTVNLTIYSPGFTLQETELPEFPVHSGWK